LLDRLHVEPDPWLGRVLARPAWRLLAEPTRDRRPGGRALDDVAGFTTARADVDDVRWVRELETAGFGIVDVGLTFAADGIDARSHPAVRFARADDAAGVRAVAASAFRYSRFHLDPWIPDEIADRVKADWATNYFVGQRGDGMIVAEIGGEIAGFLQVLLGSDGRVVIDLVAVRADARGKGLAAGMIAHAATHGTGDSRKPAGVVVGTQAANIPSVRLYEALGFRLQRTQFVLHRHAPFAEVSE